MGAESVLMPGVTVIDAVIAPRPQNGIALRTTSRGVEALDVAALPGRLNRPRVVVLADERDRLVGGHTIQNCKTCEGGARPAAPAPTGDFHAFVLGSAPCLAQRVSRVHSVGG